MVFFIGISYAERNVLFISNTSLTLFSYSPHFGRTDHHLIQRMSMMKRLRSIKPFVLPTARTIAHLATMKREKILST